jgi:hypothetical protein
MGGIASFEEAGCFDESGYRLIAIPDTSGSGKNGVKMQVKPNRPYFNKSIAQLEALLEVPDLDLNILALVEKL